MYTENKTSLMSDTMEAGKTCLHPCDIKLNKGALMDEYNISAYVDYNRAFLTIKEMYEKAILELEICNNALRGIAKELGIMNPILL